ncbi:divergent protein kinase domain 1C [Chelonus insularis]|uniref:divergent protein kinase domain 1C n=1 Tax=Chelonus insularis TaxID=460826 RepID=UPI0015898AF0|nr:divergent protein kinase domain 1C [Chelonus insularis]XP_034942751.1 divergent protein kinase domain 1C [Chelonus insularis]
MNIRRFPGFIYHHKFVAFGIFLTFFIIVYLLYHWGIVCTNLEARHHVSTVCKNFRNRKAMGVLCEPLCSEQSIHSLACENLHSGKEAVFSASWETTKLVFKTSRKLSDKELYEALYWVDTYGNKHYPSENEFEKMISDLVYNRLNITISQRHLEKLSHLRLGHQETDEERREFEMENIWRLLQENEYLMSIIYEDRELFPRLIGTCGSFYAVEYVQPLKIPSNSLTELDTIREWAIRLKLAIMIMDFVDELQNNFPESLYLCDVKINHFGIPYGDQRLKFLDLDAVFPKSIVGRFTGDGKTCIKHEDCDYFDCRSVCSTNKRCESPVVNDNLQIICEKIFLGWTLSGTIMIPGLLMSRTTTGSLAILLRQCANPHGDVGYRPRAPVPLAVKTKLYNMLTEMERQYASLM